MSKKKFFCPHCGANLNPNNKVITVTKTSTGKTGLVLQSEICGDYQYITDESFVIEKGEKLEHFCPVCQSNLQSTEFPHCSEVTVIEGKKKGRTFFANNEGEQATFNRWADGSHESFGKDKKSFFAGFESHEMNHEDREVARIQ